MEKHTIIAVDGPAASGKGTLARALAKELGFAYLDTGALYRCVGKAVLDAGGDPSDEETAAEAARNLSQTLDAKDTLDPALRADDIGQAASRVAAYPSVRAALMDFQRSYSHKIQDSRGQYGSGVILDGRDIGTVIAPDATVKFFVTASVEERAGRRFRELSAKGIDTTLGIVTDDMKMRDARDTDRDTAPLKAADDAVLLDTSGMAADDVLAKALAVVQKAFTL